MIETSLKLSPGYLITYGDHNKPEIKSFIALDWDVMGRAFDRG